MAETFLDVFCRFRHHFRNVFILSVTATLLLLWSLTIVEPGSGTYVIAVIQIVTFVVLAIFALGAMSICGGRKG